MKPTPLTSLKILAAIAFSALTGTVFAGDVRYLGSSPQGYRATRTVAVTTGVPLFFYTSKAYSSAFYGSPGSAPPGNVPCYFAASSRSSKYYRYQANPWYTDRVVYRYQTIGGSPTTRAVQHSLTRIGYYHGPVDGLMGPLSQSAIRKYQTAHALAPTGVIDEALLRTLRLR